jgi:hypothetical protein
VDKLFCPRVSAYKVKGSANHIVAGSGDNGVSLGVDRAAELVSFTAGDIQFFAHAKARVAAVFASARRS